MAHLALYREWRPRTFDEVVEQKQAVHALRQSVISGQIAHAYLFSGTRGTGKTTMAKIFARAINCLQPRDGNPCNTCTMCRSMLEGSLMDVVEMDAASNNSVDNIRRLCDEIIFMPSQARFKVYIIDEVHMLSTGAFNALLKTLEEPPAHAVFILATTEPHRIPATIVSRCQRYEFRRIPVDSMIERLQAIAAADAIDIEPQALQTIAALADGALRDAISILDQARSAFSPPISRDQVLSLVGVVRDEFLLQVATALITGDAARLLGLVDQLVMAGRDLARFVTDLAQYMRNLLVCQLSGDNSLLLRVNSSALADMRQLSSQVSGQLLIELIRGLSALLSDLRWVSDGRTALEVGLIRLMSVQEPPEPASMPQSRARQPEQVVPPQSERSVSPAPQPSPGMLPGSLPASNKTGPGSQPIPMPEPLSDAASVLSSEPSGSTIGILPEIPPETSSRMLPEPSSEMASELPLEPPPESAVMFSSDESDMGSTYAPEGISDGAWPVMTDPGDGLPVREASDNRTDSDTAGVDNIQQAIPDPVQIDAAKLWSDILNRLQASGHMTLYLFGRPAVPVLCDGVLQLHFAASDTVHYHETSQPSSLKMIRDTARQLSGADISVRPVMATGDEKVQCQPAQSGDWVSRVRSAASQLGIPVTMEE